MSNKEKTTHDLTKYIKAINDMNKSLILGLETALKVMSNWDSYTQDQRKSVIDGLDGMLKTARKASEAQIQVQ